MFVPMNAIKFDATATCKKTGIEYDASFVVSFPGNVPITQADIAAAIQSATNQFHYYHSDGVIVSKRQASYTVHATAPNSGHNSTGTSSQ